MSVFIGTISHCCNRNIITLEMDYSDVVDCSAMLSDKGNGPSNTSQKDTPEILCRESDWRCGWRSAMQYRKHFTARLLVQIRGILIGNNVTKSIHVSEVTSKSDLVHDRWCIPLVSFQEWRSLQQWFFVLFKYDASPAVQRSR